MSICHLGAKTHKHFMALMKSKPGNFQGQKHSLPKLHHTLKCLSLLQCNIFVFSFCECTVIPCTSLGPQHYTRGRSDEWLSRKLHDRHKDKDFCYFSLMSWNGSDNCTQLSFTVTSLLTLFHYYDLHCNLHAVLTQNVFIYQNQSRNECLSLHTVLLTSC